MGLNKYTIPVIGVKVLVVDDDMTSLALVSKMLSTLGYEVVTSTLASEALSIIDKDENINLVIMELHLSNTMLYELIKDIKERYDIPSFIMSADNDPSSMSRALRKGAKMYLTKPVVKSDLRYMWQFTTRKRVASGQEWQALTFQEKEEELPDKGAVEKNESQVQKKLRLKWTNDLRTKFSDAISLLGDDAGPKKIQLHMNVPGITKKQVSSRLQKYRQSLRKQANEGQQQSGLNLGSNHLPHMDVTSCTPSSSLGATPSYFPSVQNLDFKQNQLLRLPRALQAAAPATSAFAQLTMKNGNVEVGNKSLSSIYGTTKETTNKPLGALGNTMASSSVDCNTTSTQRRRANWGLLQTPCEAGFNPVENATNGNVVGKRGLFVGSTRRRPLHGSGDATVSSVDHGATSTQPGPANWGLLRDSDGARFSQVGNSVDGENATRNPFGSSEWNPLRGSGDARMSSMNYTPASMNPLHGSSNAMMSSMDYTPASMNPLYRSDNTVMSSMDYTPRSMNPLHGSDDAIMSSMDCTLTNMNPLHGSIGAIMSSIDCTPASIEPCPNRWGHLLVSGSTSVSCVDSIVGNNEMDCSTLLANDNMCLQLPSQLPVPPPLPSSGFNFGVGTRNLEDYLEIPEETPQLFQENIDVSREDQEFFAEDFDSCIEKFMSSL